MMEFFNRMRNLADKLHKCTLSKPHSSSSGDDLSEKLKELASYLSIICVRFSGVRNSPSQNGDNHSSEGLSRILIGIHSKLEAILNEIDDRFRRNIVDIWRPEILGPVLKSIDIENQKLKVLLYTFDPDANDENSIFLEMRKLRSQKIDQYVEAESRRWGLGVNQLGHHNNEFKWKQLNDKDYLNHISQHVLCDGPFEAWETYIHRFTLNLQIAQEEHVEAPDRWIHLMICSYCLMSARDSQEYKTSFKHPQDLGIKDTGFALDHYVTQLEILLFDTFTVLETRYLDPDIDEERKKIYALPLLMPQIAQPLPTVQDRRESISMTPTVSLGDEEYGVLFECQLSGEQKDYALKLGIDAKGALSLDFDGPNDLPGSLQKFRALDLRDVSIRPNYPCDEIYKCDLIPQSRATDATDGYLLFQSNKQLQEFQKALTGYNVLVEFKRGMLRTLEKKHKPQIKNVIVGGLQIWLKGPGWAKKFIRIEKTSLVQTASGSSSATSRTTLASTSILKAQEAINRSNRIPIDKSFGFRLDMPVSPLVVVFVESVLEGEEFKDEQILTFKLTENSRLELVDLKDGDNYSRCFLHDVVLCDLEIGRPLKLPKETKKLCWIEISLRSENARDIFSQHLDKAREIYYQCMAKHNDDVKFFQQWHQNT